MKYKYVFPVIFLIILSACTSSTDSLFNNSDTQKSIQKEGNMFTLTIPKVNYSIDDTLRIQFDVKYILPGQKNFVFPNLQQFGFRLTDQLNNTVLYYPGVVLPAFSRFSLGTGESKTFKYSGEFIDRDGHYIDSGGYKLTVYLLGNYPGVTLEISLN